MAPCPLPPPGARFSNQAFRPQFMPGYMEMGKQGAMQVQDHLISVVTTRFAVDNRYVDVRVVVDVDALIQKAGAWAKTPAGRHAIQGFFDKLDAHPNITVSERDVGATREVMKSRLLLLSSPGSRKGRERYVKGRVY